MKQDEFLTELQNGIIGEWATPDFSFLFGWDGVNDGTIVVTNKYKNLNAQATYKIVIKEHIPYLQIISRTEGYTGIQEFIISLLDPTTERQLVLSMPFGLSFILHKLA